MAFGSRYSLLVIFFSAAIIFSAVFTAFIFLIVFFSGNYAIDFFSAQVYWFIYDASGRGMLESILGVACLVAGGFAAFYIFRTLFRKTGSAEIFFIAVFFFSLMFEALRIGLYLSEIGGIAEFVTLAGTRIVYAGRLFGLLCLFAASLYAGNFNYQKFEILIGVALLISGFLAFSISFDQTVILSNGLLRMGDESGLFIIFTALNILIVLNYFVSNSKKKIFHSLLGIGLLIIGRELLVFALDPVFLGAGIAAAAAGCIVLFRTSESYYSWI